jgi:GTP-binding protein HflX
MRELIQTKSNRERAVLVGGEIKGSRPLLKLEDSLQELALLADTAGVEVIGQVTQRMTHIDPNTFIGSGKLEELHNQALELDAQIIVFDDELSPRHQRELEKVFGENIKVLDRSALILDIFAQHANTREGTLQVELAQYEYRLPRLTRAWTHLARQAGGGGARGGSAGVGLRGPGETQLEVDKREIGRKIVKLKEDLEKVKQHRRHHRRQRIRSGIPVVALVGYTNAGKSTLLQAISGTDVYVADQLFATLDPLTRRIELPSGRQILMTDTVGFIQKLPTTLIAAFRATLEETIEADILIHVVDASHLNVLEHIETIEDILAQIEMPNIPRILVWNKSDKRDDPLLPERIGHETYFHQVSLSAKTGHGVSELLETIERALTHYLQTVTLFFPFDRGDLVSYLFQTATVEHQEHTESGIILRVQLPPSLLAQFEPFQFQK